MRQTKWSNKEGSKLKTKEGNDEADRVADDAIKLFGEQAIQTGALLTCRHLGYTKVVEWMRTFFIEHIFKRKQALEAAKEKHQPQNWEETDAGKVRSTSMSHSPHTAKPREPNNVGPCST